MSGKLSKKTLEELPEAFVIFDKDGDNRINMQEAATVMRSLGFSPTEAELEVISRECGGGGNRTFDLPEVQKILQKAPPGETSEGLQEAFRIFDKDGNGFIGVAELRHVLTNLGERLTDEEVDELIHETDISGHGQINYDDCVKILLSGQN